MKQRNTLIFILFLLGFSEVSLGDGHHPGAISLKGFGSSGAVASSTPIIFSDYSRKGKEIDLTSPLKLGLSASSRLNESVSVKGQFSTRLVDTDYLPQFDWGFVSWEFFDGLQIRGGRVIAPIWMYSQQIDVGFSYVWIRPPTEVYALNSLRSLNGASLLVQKNIPGGFFTLDVYGGQGIHNFADLSGRGEKQDVILSLNDAIGATVSYSMLDDSFTFVGNYGQGHLQGAVYSDLTLGAETLTGQSSLAGKSIPLQLETPFDSTFGQFYSAGLKVDLGQFFLFSEIASRRINGQMFPKADGAYVTTGLNLGDLTPHFTWSRRFNQQGTSYLHPIVNPLDPSTPGLFVFEKVRQSYTLGLNYSPVENAVFKISAAKVNLTYDQASYNFDFWLYGLQADFVF